MKSLVKVKVFKEFQLANNLRSSLSSNPCVIRRRKEGFQVWTTEMKGIKVKGNKSKGGRHGPS